MHVRMTSVLAASLFAITPALARQSHERAETKTAPKLSEPTKAESKPLMQRPAEPKPEAKFEAKSEGKPEVKRGESKPAEGREKPETKPDPETDRGVTPELALSRLQEGNERWAAGKTQNPRTDAARMKAQAEGQTPFAAVLTCADSRIPVERIFDQGVGDIFDVRVAGNIAGDHETGSLEYGAEHLKAPLLVVLGHTKCGAVNAAATQAAVGGHIPTLIQVINPSVARAQALNPTLKGAELVPAAIKENVWQSVFTILKTSPICRERIAKGELKVIGAVYNVADGSIEWMGEHPWQSELLAAFGPKGEPATEQAAHSENER